MLQADCRHRQHIASEQHLCLLQGCCMHVDIVAQAASEETSAVHHVEGECEEHQSCMEQTELAS